MSASIPNIKLCYLKDAAEFRRLNENLLLKNLSEIKNLIRDRQSMGIDIFLWSYEGQEGYFYLQNPMSQESWAIIFYEYKTISSRISRKIAEAVFHNFPTLYRLDSYSVLEGSPSDTFRNSKGQFDGDHAISGLSYYSPQFSQRQLAFIGWRFGYIALVTSMQGDKISSINFVRRNRKMDNLVRSFAHFYELFDEDGNIGEGLKDPVLLKPPTGLQPLNSVLEEAAEQIVDYLKGDRHEFSFPFTAEEGTSFQREVWQICENIPYAKLFSYKDIAKKIVKDEKKAILLSRAVGQALGANPLPICIPCHRVVGKNRDLTGFAGGVDIKDHLLNLEFLKYN